MIKIDVGNAVLKPSHLKQIKAWLRRSQELSSRLGRCVVTLTLHRTGKVYEARASVCGNSKALQPFELRARQQDWFHAFRDLVRDLTHRLHDQCLRRALA